MIAEIISVGTEILLGNIVNTNAQYLAKKLAEAGIEVHFQTVVGDNPGRIMDAVRIAYTRGDMVIMTGGLGPTKDDITKEMLAEYFHRKLAYDQKALDMMGETLRRVQKESLLQSLKKQALVPDNSMILYNHHGLAPGMIMEDEGKVCILLPGPPKEMCPMFEEYCMDYLRKKSGHILISVNIKMLDFDHAPVIIVGEAPVADRLGDLLDSSDPTVATYAKDDGCLIRITSAAKTHEEALEKIAPVVEEAKKRLGEEYINYIKEDTGD
ncbi:MAG: damage-inducible protein CinA [Solobacterium sp.]|nr:damage-inducible protein CinA [Solobacterium sp.]